jgi:hypothetical protein
MKRLLLGTLLLALFSTTLFAQNTAQINGSVKDASGAVLPGVEVTATQTATGATRSAVTNETGAFTLVNLAVGPYQLEAVLPGFRTFSQSGIVLQVGASPVVNVTLEVGQVTETVEVQADAALVETRATGVGQVIDNVRVMELPLGGRQVTELIILSGAAVGGGQQNSPRNYPTDIISVGGGSNNSLAFSLDGGAHNDPYGNQALPLPFPDALQEFKVETSTVPAQYGFFAAGAVNVVTKSGTNQFHGSLFEFVRNRAFNARNTFAAEKDPLKRNQFGGVIGGPIVGSKLFFFAGMQITYQRTDAKGTTAYVPTPQMLAGDWTTYASSQCQSSPVTLRAPFQNNRIDPGSFSRPALEVLKRLNVQTVDACGKVSFGRRTNQDEYLPVAKIDWQISDKHSMFGRWEMARLDTPSDYDGQTILSISLPDYYRHAKSFVLGDTYSITSTMISSFRGTVLRTVNEKTLADQFTFTDLGVRGHVHPENYPKIALISVSGAFNILTGPSTPSVTNTTVVHFGDDVSWLRGTHQIGFGANYIHNVMNYTSSTSAPGSMAFTAANTGLSLGDFMTGRANTFNQSGIGAEPFRQNFFALYLQDTWKASSKLTLNYGVRWEPYFGPYDASSKRAFFSRERFDQGLKSEVFPNAPAGVFFQGEGGVPDTLSMFSNDYGKRFAPRLGVAFDPKGDGLMTIRAAYGLFFATPHLHQSGGRRDTPPGGTNISVNTPSFEDPWASYPGGVSPYPVAVTKNTTFPLSTRYVAFPWDMKMPYINQWNLSVQRQVGSNWLLAANYIGNNILHTFFRNEANPAVYVPGVGDANRNCFLNGKVLSFTANTGTQCSTTGNTNSRRLLTLANPQVGQYFTNIANGDDGGTRTYSAMVLQIQRRRANGMTVQGNYTWSHCIDDGYNDVIQNTGGQTPERRGLNRANCELDRRHNFNMSTVYDTPRFSNPTVNLLAGGWSFSGIVRILSGPYKYSQMRTCRIRTWRSGSTPRRSFNRAVANTATRRFTSRREAGFLPPAAFESIRG